MSRLCSAGGRWHLLREVGSNQYTSFPQEVVETEAGAAG